MIAKPFFNLHFFALVFLAASCSVDRKAPDAIHDLVEYNGRVDFDSTGRVGIYWPGSSVKTRFTGSTLKATLRDQRAHNNYNVIIDDDSVYHFRPDTLKKSYTLASGLAEGEHTVELFRLDDWNNGKTWFYGFDYESDANVLPVLRKKRTMEFYGNSITVGAAIEDSVSGLSNNHYLSYAAVTARHYDAAYSCIARSGIGLMVSWFSLIMPEMYDRLDPFDSTSTWDFSKNVPDVVVVNLMQNDYALSTMPDYDQFKKRFGDTAPTDDFIISSYRDFILKLRNHYPRAHIVCVLGNMDATSPGSAWPGYIIKAATSLNDKKVYTCFFPFKNTDGHPKVGEHRQMADSLIAFIDRNIQW
jgi:hypothetical protein